VPFLFSTTLTINYSSDNAICGCWLAWANIELDACCKTELLANAALSAA
jgi:hypothetical protein